MDWLSYGLPAERGSDTRLAGDFVDRGVPRCRFTSLVGDAKQAAYEMGLDACAVVNAEGIVLGLCGREALHADPKQSVGQVMDPGPTTIRPSATVESALKLLHEGNLRVLLVTTPDGRLLGCFDRRRAEAG